MNKRSSEMAHAMVKSMVCLTVGNDVDYECDSNKDQNQKRSALKESILKWNTKLIMFVDVLSRIGCAVGNERQGLIVVDVLREINEKKFSL